jgi:hypothetical protein
VVGGPPSGDGEDGALPFEGFPALPVDPHGDEPAYDADEPVAVSAEVAEGRAHPGVVELVADPGDEEPRWRVAALADEPDAALQPDARRISLAELVEAHPAVEALLLLGEPGRFTWDPAYQAFLSAEDRDA